VNEIIDQPTWVKAKRSKVIDCVEVAVIVERS